MFSTTQKQAENTRTVESSTQDVSIDEKTRMEREMKSNDEIELERINRTRQQSSEDREVNTSVRQQVTAVHERTEVDESKKLLESYSGEVVNNIMKCGPNINLANARNMVTTVLVDESITRAVDGSQAVVVQGDRNVVRNIRLHNMINLVGDTSVYNCVAKQVSDLITKKDALLSASNTATGSNVAGPDLETEGSKITDENKADMGAKNLNEADLDKDSNIDNEFGAEGTASAGQRTSQRTVLDFLQGAGGGGLGSIILVIVIFFFGIIAFVVWGFFSTAKGAISAATDAASGAAAAVTGQPPPDREGSIWPKVGAIVALAAVVYGMVMLVTWAMKDEEKPKEGFGLRLQEQPTPAEQYVAAALAAVLLLLIVHRFAAGGPPKMVGGGRGWPSFYELYMFVLALGAIGASVAFFVTNP